MLKLISNDEEQTWDNVLEQFPNASIYYSRQYCKAFQIHGDGDPVMVSYENKNGLKGICVIMKRDISFCHSFSNYIKEGEVFDAVTPYGYGGFIFNRNPSKEEQEQLSNELKQTLQKEKIISLFIRFSPLLANADSSRHILDVIDLGNTISMDLNNEEILLANMKRENRNRIRKAQKNGVVVKYNTGEEIMNQFIPIYEETMNADNANDYYFFKPEFYNSIVNDLKGKYKIFLAEYMGQTISGIIIIYHNDSIEYHLGGTKRDYRNLAAANLLLYSAALWGIENGFKTFHLGGGVGSGEDNLYRFKSTFNKNSNNRFSIGKLIVDETKYNYLVGLREKHDPDFNSESTFFPLYRS